ncbi:MAG: 1-acyl-sn-glycerol-3-phosphate acyltransferase [Bacteroidales bacterium]|nr:1-acyl-sn-glycerol-3-phosphate acyltransferase [Bacteroidales bacterium]
MSRLFIAIYHRLSGVRPIMYLFLLLLVSVLLYLASTVSFVEDPSRFFPKENGKSNTAELFSRIRVKDKIIVLFTSRTDTLVDSRILTAAAAKFDSVLLSARGKGLVKATHLKVDQSGSSEITEYIYSNLPIFLEKKDYLRIDSLISADSVRSFLSRGMASLLSPAGSVISAYFSKDPLGLATPLLSSLKELQSGMKYNIVDNHLFSSDNSTLLYIVDPLSSSNDIKRNGELLDLFDSLKVSLTSQYNGLDVEYMGAPFATVYNARQIKADTWLTMSIAMFLIIVVLWLAFRRFRDIFLLLLPALFGAVFSLAIISLFKDSFSAIAVGAGATVMGIALSYSIHIVSHMKHVTTVEQMLEELSYPLTIGSFTTIGAFAGLLFTNSSLLQDFGLFSSIALVGTTLFSLIFLPHMLKIGKDVNRDNNIVMTCIDAITKYKYEKSGVLISLILLLFAIGIFFSSKVNFQSDMMAINYEPSVLKEAQQRYAEKFGSIEAKVLLLSTDKDVDKAFSLYRNCDSVLNTIKAEGIPITKSSLSRWLIPRDLQKERIERWNEFWSARSSNLKRLIAKESGLSGFSGDAFNDFFHILDKKYSDFDLSAGRDKLPDLMGEWCEISDSCTVLITQLFVKGDSKKVVYDRLSETTDAVIVDRAHFAGLWATSIKDDFYFILTLSSLLVFLTLLISYGRFELALLAFLPMFISWVIILGLMALLGIEFNIVNILLSTFIFGIGDDFSIFVLDGLQGEYSRKSAILSSHKSAIFFSTFTVIIGMGVLILAKHPALRSIALISTVGMVAVWFVALTVQPIIFRYFITAPVRKGLPPYTLSGLLLMLLTFSVFVTGCIIAAVYISIIVVLPIPGKYKRASFHKFLCAFSFLPVRLSPSVKIFRENPYKEDFSKPAIIVANHQSFIDILMMLSLSPKVIMMTNSWVWKSPVFGHIVRYAGFLYYKDGVENHVEQVRRMTQQGYSVIIFPEGTRSSDLNIHRFRKGAFYLAEKLSLDILPVVIYGNGHLVSKLQPFYVKHGIIGYRILPRIKHSAFSNGTDYRKMSREVCSYMRGEYQAVRQRFDNTHNGYFYHSVILNYIYKGPVLEWYMRIKIKMEKSYSVFDSIIPKDARITDIGCGYGPLCFMLGLLSEKRSILGIDYDGEKINIAENCYLASDRIRFQHGDALLFDFPESDVFILNDMLHYLSQINQRKLLERVVAKLAEGGVVIVRDADKSDEKKHFVTRMSELFSIKILKFNKANQAPCFIERMDVEKWAIELNCSVEAMKNDKITSNTIYLLRKKRDE